MRATVAVVKDPFGGRPPPRGGRQLPVREPCGVVAASYRCGNPVSGEDHHPHHRVPTPVTAFTPAGDRHGTLITRNRWTVTKWFFF
jgi:hypothetical protein